MTSRSQQTDQQLGKGGGASRQSEKASAAPPSAINYGADRFAGDWTTWNVEMREMFATTLVGRDITDYNTAMAAINSGDTAKINEWQNTLYPERGQTATERQVDTSST